MAGHSHWAQIKHKKAKIDAQRGKLFSKLIKEITVATRLGGPNPEFNPRLRTAIEQARKANMPMETIERAIKKGSGELEGESYEEVIYEGYGPGGVAVMVITTTDNRNRTSAEVKHAFSKHGGSLGSSGCVSYLFERKGYIEVPASDISEEEIFEKAVEAGAEDVQSGLEIHQVYTSPEELYEVKEKLEKLGVPVEKAQITWIPVSTVSVSDAETAKRVLKLIDALDDLEDVQQVIANFEVPEEVLQQVEA
ncbi:YebC/PmpR family DNA-binding regulatory protein [Hydrogenivirga caldilitoris]|uniref:Probable transcriptional regulatory protein BCF55_1683 n=1 Tax=Hydrogenivirga caldilitoris TaxID=246264 RepID=A0A497XSY8_9AQUI|nr:YebC/PmpR family DNA-binding transcriptional regulator [Hydrogenivirga caldilitoris]RLJ71381.1 YebC/PmpR family DNA-binding regulatory protein [Hydrogenivirga caldilitoris]